MKKIYNIFLTTFIIMISLFMGSKVYARQITKKTCVYESEGYFNSGTEEWVIKISNRTKKNVAVIDEIKNNNNNAQLNTSGLKIKGVDCPKNFYVEYNVELDTYFLYSASSSARKKAKLKESIEEPTCTDWSSISSKYQKDLDDISSAMTNFEKTLSNTYSPVEGKTGINGHITKFTVKNLDDKLTCTDLDKYNNYIFNTMKLSKYNMSKSDLKKAETKLTTVETNINQLDICENDDYNKFMNSLNNYVTEINSFYSAYDTFASKMEGLRLKKECKGDASALADAVENLYNDWKAKQKSAEISGFKFNFTEGCAVIDGELKKFLNAVLWYIKIVAIVLAAILSLVDYIKAAAGADDKPMAAANKRFMTRLVLIMVLFLLPAILTFTLDVLNIETASSESIACLDK